MASAKSLAEVQKTYLAFYQRPADPAGQAYWAERLDSANGNLNEIISAFSNTVEAANRYFPGAQQDQKLSDLVNSQTIGSVIDKIYLALLGRLPDAAGRKYYVDEFTAGRVTPGSISLSIVNGAIGADATVIASKLALAQTFSDIVDGRNVSNPDYGIKAPFSVSYSGNGDALVARDFIAAKSGGATAEETIDFIKNNIADAGDPILRSTSSLSALTGTSGNDVIIGSAGNDSVLGMAGNDIVQGGAGNDTLNGGVGSDTFRFENSLASNGIDLVQDFSSAVGGDVFDFSLFLGATTVKHDASQVSVSSGFNGGSASMGVLTASTSSSNAAPYDNMDAALSQGALTEAIGNAVLSQTGPLTGNQLSTISNDLASSLPVTDLANKTIAALKVLRSETTDGLADISEALIAAQFSGKGGAFAKPILDEQYVILASVEASPSNASSLPDGAPVHIFYVQFDASSTNNAKVTLVGKAMLGAGNDVDNFVAENFL